MRAHHCVVCGFSLAQSFRFTSWNGIPYVRCPSCSSLMQEQVINHSVNIGSIPEVYEERYWERAVDPDGNIKDLTTMRDFKMKNWFGSILAYANRLQGGTVLDVGSGLNFLLSGFSSDKWDLNSIDMSKFAVRFSKSNFPQINAMLGDHGQLIQQGKKYDLVISYHVVEHVCDPVTFIKELQLLVKPGGFLIVGTPSSTSLASKLFKGRYRMLGPEHLVLFSTRSFKALMNAKSEGLVLQKFERPFKDTEYCTIANALKLCSLRGISPPCYGNLMTAFSRVIA